MIQSLLIKLGMLAGTIAVVFWIGWTVPAAHDEGATATSPTSQSAPTSPGLGSVVAHDAATPTPSPKSPAREALLKASSRLDLNRATATDFESLPGIGPVLAKRIVEYRTANGSFRTVDDLKRVKGIGAKKFAKVRPLLNITPTTEPAERARGNL